MMRSSTLTTGSTGEAIAQSYLISKGYTILNTHYTSRWGEIDLVVQKDGVIIFVEVKTRTSSWFGRPEDHITWRKLRSLYRVMGQYLQTQVHGTSHINQLDTEPDYQLDIIAIHLPNGYSYPSADNTKPQKIEHTSPKPRIRHYKRIDISGRTE